MRTVAALLLLLLFLPGAYSPSSAPGKFFLGFDRNDYPGDDAMKFLHREFVFTSYWLGNPPGEKSNSWSGRRELLRSQGWGFLPLFGGPTSGELRDEPYTLKQVPADTQVWQFVRSPRNKEPARHCRGYAKNGNCYAVFDAAHKYHLDMDVARSADPSAPR